MGPLRGLGQSPAIGCTIVGFAYERILSRPKKQLTLIRASSRNFVCCLVASAQRAWPSRHFYFVLLDHLRGGQNSALDWPGIGARKFDANFIEPYRSRTFANCVG